MRAWYVILPVGLLCGFAACGGDDSTTGTSGTGGSGGSTGGSGGSGGATDAGGDVSTGGSGGGAAGKGGGAGAGTGGGAGATGGGAGAGGTAGKGGSGGSAGATGTGGASGTGGGAGTGGATGGAAGTSGAAGTGGTAGTGGAAGSGGSGGSSGGDAGPSVSVLQYHNNASRDGVYIDPVMTKAAAATMHVDTTFAMATHTGPVYAQPLYLAGNGTVSDLVIVATNQNHLIGFNAASGAKVYDQTLAAPVPKANLASLRATCGNVDPLGIIGTPVIDGATRSIYLSSEQLSGSNAKHMVYAIDANNGMTRAGWPIDIGTAAKSSNATFNALAQHQRGALAIVGGRLLVPYGGHYGDCGDYHGWVVSIDTATPTQVSAFATRAIAGGIWAPSGIASDGTNVYFSTGNTQAMTNSFTPPAMYGDGNTVFKLPPSLAQTGAMTEYFVPTNWSALDQADDDLGGVGPILVEVPGATPSNLIVQFGKDQKAYLINRDTMGGQSAPIAAPTVAGSAIVGAGVAYRTAMGTYALFRGAVSGCPSGQTGSMAAIRITAGSPPTAAVAWCGGAATNKSPAVSMTNAGGTDALVWIVGNDNRLRAYDGDTGTVVFNGGAAGDVMGASSNFITPIIANGRIFVSANAQTWAFRP